MSAAHLPRNKKDRSVRPRKHDQYKAKARLDLMGCGGGCNPLLHKVVDLGE